MVLKRCLIVLAVAVPTLASSAIACSGTTGPSDGGADSSAEVGSRDVHATDAHPRDAHASDSGADSPVRDARPVDAQAPVLVELSVTSAAPDASPDASPPIGLVPAFSPDVHDYYVRCPAATNELTVSMTASSGAETQLLAPETSPRLPKQTITPLSVGANQAIVAEVTGPSTTAEYWVRCLPPGFPTITWDPHPEAGTPPQGYYLVGTFSAANGYAIVLDGNGVPVWYHAATYGVSDVDSVVTGAVSFLPLDVTHPGGGRFEVHALTSTPVAAPDVAPDGAPLDFHELEALSGGDYLVLSDPIQTGVDLTGMKPVRLSDGGSLTPGPGSSLIECTIVDFVPATGVIVWTWQATDHFDPALDSVEPILGVGFADGGTAGGIDAFHCNSIDVDPATGNLLVSARQMNSVFYIERSTGKVLWKLGGAMASKDSATYIPVASTFTGQHDARLQPGWSTCAGGQISLFDDATYSDGGPARAVLYDVALGPGDGGCDGGTAGASVAWQYLGAMRSPDTGSFRISADGSRVIGWGISSSVAFTEVDEKQDDLLDLRFKGNGTYRAIKVPLAAFDRSVMRMTAGLP